MKPGIFISTCGGVVSKALDLESLSRDFQSYPCVRTFENFYDANDFNSILDEVENSRLDALVLAGESPQFYSKIRNGKYLVHCLADRGIPRSHIEFVNLKNMVVAPHQADRTELQLKARLLIEVGLEKLKASKAIEIVEVSPRQAVAVIGANTGNIFLSQHLLNHGYKVYFIHRGNSINLPAKHLAFTGPTFNTVTRSPRFKIFNQSVIEDFYGYTGDFTLEIDSEKGREQLLVGAVVLSLEGDRELIKMAHAKFHVDVNDDGSMAVRDETTGRSLTREEGIFVIRQAKNDPEDSGQIIAAADAAATMVINLLNRKEIYHRVTVSQVDEKLCGGCGVCIKTCMFHAVSLRGHPEVSVIDPRRCMGCGNCVTACPSGARDLLDCPSGYLYNAVDVLAKFKTGKNGNPILLLTCAGCGYESLDNAAAAGLKWPVQIMPLALVCGGQIDTQLIMHAFTRGFDGVILLTCGEGCCHHIIGNVDLERRIYLFRDILASRGIDPRRVHVIPTCSRGGNDSINEINRFLGQFLGELSSSATIPMRQYKQ